VATTVSLSYTSKGWNDGLTSVNSIYYHYNYLELEEEGLGVIDEP